MAVFKTFIKFLISDPVLDRFQQNVKASLDSLTGNTNISNVATNQSYAATFPAGAASIGQVVWNTAPTSGGFVGWVCTVSGNPGTWKTFGAIS